MLNFFRKLIDRWIGPEPAISRDAAEEIVRQYAEREDWTIDPIIVDLETRNKEPVYVVRTNVNWIDGSTNVTIHAETGEILSIHTPTPGGETV